MTRTMYDSTSALTIPFGVQLAAGYVDGLYKWQDAWWHRFSSATVLVHIAVFAETDAGDFLDVERGDATPDQAPGWVTMRRAAGHPAPAVYMNAETWPAVRAAFAAQKVAEPLYIVADYDGLAVVPDGAFGKQFAALAGYDLSVIGDYWPGVDPPIPLDPRRDDVHVDLQPGKATVFTNPAAVLGGTSHMCLASDFGDATVRVATFSFKSGTWDVLPLVTVGRTAGAYKLALPADTNKVSVTLLPAGACPVGMDVFA